jgi:hypothetical protein
MSDYQDVQVTKKSRRVVTIEVVDLRFVVARDGSVASVAPIADLPPVGHGLPLLAVRGINEVSMRKGQGHPRDVRCHAHSLVKAKPNQLGTNLTYV